MEGEGEGQGPRAEGERPAEAAPHLLCVSTRCSHALLSTNSLSPLGASCIIPRSLSTPYRAGQKRRPSPSLGTLGDTSKGRAAVSASAPAYGLCSLFPTSSCTPALNGMLPGGEPGSRASSPADCSRKRGAAAEEADRCSLPADVDGRSRPGRSRPVATPALLTLTPIVLTDARGGVEGAGSTMGGSASALP